MNEPSADENRSLDVTVPRFYSGLELLRFLGALAVLVWHFQHFENFFLGLEVGVGARPFDAVFWPFYAVGNYAVEVFWSISGFIFGVAYLGVAGRQVSTREFLVNRLARLYPLHLVTLLSVAALQAIYWREHEYYFIYQNNDLFHFLLNLVFINGWGLQSGDSFNAPSWSVSVEVIAYGAFLILLKLAPNNRHFLYSGILVALSVLMVVFNVRSIIPNVIFYFFLGFMVFLLHRDYYEIIVNDHRWFVAIISGIGFAWMCWLLSVGLAPKYFFAVVSPLVVLISTIWATFPIRWLDRFFGLLGRYSYGMYLMHFIVQLLMVLLLTGEDGYFQMTVEAVFVVYALITFVFSVFVFHFIENPLRIYLRSRLAGTSSHQ